MDCHTDFPPLTSCKLQSKTKYTRAEFNAIMRRIRTQNATIIQKWYRKLLLEQCTKYIFKKIIKEYMKICSVLNDFMTGLLNKGHIYSMSFDAGVTYRNTHNKDQINEMYEYVSDFYCEINIRLKNGEFMPHIPFTFAGESSYYF